jgi:hypothetical protein
LGAQLCELGAQTVDPGGLGQARLNTEPLHFRYGLWRRAE